MIRGRAAKPRAQSLYCADSLAEGADGRNKAIAPYGSPSGSSEGDYDAAS